MVRVENAVDEATRAHFGCWEERGIHTEIGDLIKQINAKLVRYYGY